MELDSKFFKIKSLNVRFNIGKESQSLHQVQQTSNFWKKIQRDVKTEKEKDKKLILSSNAHFDNFTFKQKEKKLNDLKITNAKLKKLDNKLSELNQNETIIFEKLKNYFNQLKVLLEKESFMHSQKQAFICYKDNEQMQSINCLSKCNSLNIDIFENKIPKNEENCYKTSNIDPVINNRSLNFLDTYREKEKKYLNYLNEDDSTDDISVPSTIKRNLRISLPLSSNSYADLNIAEKRSCFDIGMITNEDKILSRCAEVEFLLQKELTSRHMSVENVRIYKADSKHG